MTWRYLEHGRMCYYRLIKAAGNKKWQAAPVMKEIAALIHQHLC
jgi:hypothetical protein